MTEVVVRQIRIKRTLSLARRAAIIVSALTAILFVLPGAGSAQEPHRHEHDAGEKIGRVNFVISCAPASQTQFNRAVAWLHSFEYEEAERAFTKITSSDPRCGMAYWGIAMSNYHPLWAPPGAMELQKGLKAIATAKAVSARTQRERDYIGAIEVFYKDSDKLDHRARAFAYCEAMQQLFRGNPSDHEAGVLYSLALIATGAMAHDKTYAREKEAAQILNRILKLEPQHPGVTHYLIHGYDYPALASLALPAARGYAKIAPDSAHARHMPSHIFTRLGFWQEAIQSNIDAEAAGKAYAVRNKMAGAWDEQLHAMDYLAYAYLQRGQDEKAWGVLDELNRIQRVDPMNFKVAYAFTAIPARYALERRQWSEAAQLSFPPNNLKDFPWERFRWAEAHIHFARAVGAARGGDTSLARTEVEQLASIRETLAVIKGDYDWARQVEIEGLVASAWLAQAEGKRDESLKLMRQAADLDDATEKHPVTPGAILPAREQLGELLLELERPGDALIEFETALRTTPNRFNGLCGAARASSLAGDQKNAKLYFTKLLTLAGNADGARPGLDEAKAFLKNSTHK